ncbi:MAG TPA: response regulator [Dehalococcoidia bacterium]|nr:response regulator [Dehalococcoidia bacterium]
MSRRILVVEDDRETRDLLTGILELADFEVDTAEDGQKALNIIARETPAAMVLDMRLPVMDGWGVAGWLHEHGLHVPTVVMTGENAERCCADIGADACLQKPFDLETLLAEVVRIRTHDSWRRAHP